MKNRAAYPDQEFLSVSSPRRKIPADALENYYQWFTPHTTLPVVLFGFYFSPAGSTNSDQQLQKAAGMPPQTDMTARVTESSPRQLPMLHNQQIREMLVCSPQEGDLNTRHVTDSVINDDWYAREFCKMVIPQFNDVSKVSKKQDISRTDATTLESKFYSEAKSEVDGVTYIVRPLPFCPEAESSSSGAPNTTSQRGEKPQVSVFPTAVNDDWHSLSLRRKIISRIAEVKSSLGDLSVGMKEPDQMENEVFCKVKTKKDYLANIARVLASLKERKRWNATAQQNSRLLNLSPQPIRTQDIINVRVVQDTIQQVPKQHFSSTKLSASSQLCHPAAAENADLTTTDDWRSLGFRQKIISRIVGEMKKSNDPKLFIKNPNDMEMELYSRAKTRMEYLNNFLRLIIFIRRTRSTSTAQL